MTWSLQGAGGPHLYWSQVCICFFFVSSHYWLHHRLYVFCNVLVSMGCHNEMLWTGWLKQQTFRFSQFRRLRSLQSRCGQGSVPVTALFLAYRELPSHCVFICWRKRPLQSLPLSEELSDQSFVLVISFNFNHLLKGPIFNTVTWEMRVFNWQVG